MVHPGEMAMTRNKDLKRIVRARMQKTGESYTSARAQITREPGTKPARVPSDYAKLAGMSDAVIEKKTGRTWEQWVRALDHHGAGKMAHRDIAVLVSREYKVASWWTQSVTVGYERIKGLRTRGQQRNGTYRASKSRTFNVPATRLFAAWADDGIRRRWLSGAKTSVRTATASKSIRLDWNDSIVAVGFLAKGKSRSAVAVEHPNIPDRETADALKHYWSDRLDALSDLLVAEGT